MTDPRLGRFYVRDTRDWSVDRLHTKLGLAATPIPASMLWQDATVLDQGNASTCVGNGWAGWGDSLPVEDTYTETDARAIYFEATKIDGQPDDPDAPGGGRQGSTVRSGAKAMQARGRLSAYAFTTTVEGVREWLANHGPVVFGTDWTNDMFAPDAKGFVKPTGGVAGGHCYVCIGYDATSFRFRNSWGTSFGINGDFLMKTIDVSLLLAGIESPGEACTAAEVGAVPQPISPPDITDATFAAVLRHWVAERHYGENKTVQVAAQAWLKSKDLA